MTDVGRTISNQLQALTPTPVLWSWGATKFQIIGVSTDRSRSIQGVGEDYAGGLLFFVRGKKHRGHVLITLAYNDTYTVSIGSVRKGKINPKKQVKDVFFDQLSDVVDELIEKQDNYAF